GQEWFSDLDEAVDHAISQNKKVFLFFSVPDACEACERLEEKILTSDVFLDYAKNHYVLTRLEFLNTPGYSLAPEIKAQNLLIVEKYNKDGFFPLVVVLDTHRRVMGKVGVYQNETPQQYIALLSAFDDQ